MTPTELLKHEHKIILMVLEAAEREVNSISVNRKVNSEKIIKMLDFFRNFADKCHHAKEENHLFNMMNMKGMPSESGPIFVMLKDHDEGHKRLRAVADSISPAEAGDAGAVIRIRENLSAYIEMLRAHIQKEDNVLYPMADNMFSRKDQDELSAAFEKVEKEEIGTGVHEKYHALAHELEKN